MGTTQNHSRQTNLITMACGLWCSEPNHVLLIGTCLQSPADPGVSQPPSPTTHKDNGDSTTELDEANYNGDTT